MRTLQGMPLTRLILDLEVLKMDRNVTELCPKGTS